MCLSLQSMLNSVKRAWIIHQHSTLMSPRKVRWIQINNKKEQFEISEIKKGSILDHGFTMFDLINLMDQTFQTVKTSFLKLLAIPACNQIWASWWCKNNNIYKKIAQLTLCLALIYDKGGRPDWDLSIIHDVFYSTWKGIISTKIAQRLSMFWERKLP